jgi:SAM-dependent methyltransferase
MADGSDAADWSAVAAGWSELWGETARPAQDALIGAAGIAPDTRVLDVGCGSGEFLRVLTDAGAQATGVDPAAGMRERARASGAEVHAGDAEHLPFPDGSFDVVTAVNALQFAEDIDAALREFARVLAPGGRIAIANWAEHERNDIDVLERALAQADGDELLADGPLRAAGGLEAALGDAGFRVVASGIVDIPWRAADDETLVRGILLGEDEEGLAERGPTVIAAAALFRDRDTDRDGGGYLLRNSFRWAVAASCAAS